MSYGYPNYWIHHGPPSSLGPFGPGSGFQEAQAAQATFQNLAYPIGDSGFVGSEEVFAGLDVPALSAWGHQLGQQLGTWGNEAVQAFGGVGQAFGQGATSTWAPLGDAPQKASSAADAAKIAADEARVTLNRLNQAADHASDGARSVAETARVAKFAIIGLSILGGAALIYYIAK
jgi:hypothetical protein